MKTTIASALLSIALLGLPVAAQAPQVEPADILKQSQAERTRDQPGNNAPTWRQVKAGEENYSSLPYPESGVLIQPKAQFPGQAQPTTAGEAWRRFRNGPLTHGGGWLLLAAAALLGAFYFFKGPIRPRTPPTGRRIERFTPFERTVHWTVAISFVLLAVSGLTMLFGKYVLMPVFGHTLFGWLTYLLKTVHNFAGPVFSVGIVALFLTFVKDNLPRAADLGWLLSGGGMFGKGHPHAWRFNAGEKLWFWGGAVVLGLTVSASGFVLDKLVPDLAYTRALMQVANVIHLVAAVLLAAIAMGHIYLGTVGTTGTYEGMRHGTVDDAWAMEHHDLWYAQVEAGEIPRLRSDEGAVPASAAPKPT
ncbi:MAG: formate dehydrogenase subunit gamma [Pseudomonadota bacterium]